ncbi:hypothetical protein P8452_53760 [Trifolium repens]|nr:hypothetical protein P8452_53760 [Trifolium repens]
MPSLRNLTTRQPNQSSRNTLAAVMAAAEGVASGKGELTGCGCCCCVGGGALRRAMRRPPAFGLEGGGIGFRDSPLLIRGIELRKTGAKFSFLIIVSNRSISLFSRDLHLTIASF